MIRQSDNSSTQGSISHLLMLALTAVALAVVELTGGRSSEFVSLLFLPIILAVLRYRFEAALSVGLGITFLYLALPSGRAAGTPYNGHDLARVVSLNAITLISAFYAKQVQRERVILQERVDEKEALLNVSQVVNSCDKLEYALNSALLMLTTLIPDVRYAAIFLVDDARKDLAREADIGASSTGHLPPRIEPDMLAKGWSLDSPEPHYVADATAILTSSHQSHQSHLGQPLMSGAASYACVSLRSLKVPVGLLYVSADRPGAFSAGSLRLLKAFAERIAFPIQKIRIQEGLRNLAFSDPMTGLNNYRAFRMHLVDEWKRAVRYRRPLSIIILDLDGFKGINDRYGHPCGDRLLIALADTLRETVRETDVPARYGGEEFAVVCPETSGADALIVAERIRSAVEASRHQLAPDETTAITCSVGVATFPQHAESEATLIEAADAALYYAKRSGKNRVRSADSLPFLSADTGT